MGAKIFLLGATGYIGGDALYALLEAHPEAEGELTCLVRSSDKASLVAKKYPAVRFVYGTLDSSDLLEEEARKADIVMNFADCDHVGAATALVKGLSAHTEDRPGWYIHTSGTGILMFSDIERGVFGEASSKIYDDWDNINEVETLPDHAPHRPVDKVVLAAGTDKSAIVKTAIVAPPVIYGPGRGPGNTRSVQVYELAKATFETKHGVQIGQGKTIWNYVHVHDLSDLYLKLYEAALAGGGKATWGIKGYYFAEDGQLAWGDISKRIAVIAHKQNLIPTDEVKVYSVEEGARLSKFGATMWAGNSRSKAIRGKQLLGWKPQGKSVFDELPDAVASEAKRLGI